MAADAGALAAGTGVRLGTSVRVRPVAQTIERARRLMPVLGISRVTDVTRLDRLGLPVYAGIRPRGRTLCVHAGKGLAGDDARVGALMESVEFAVAEHASARGADQRLTIGELATQLPAGVRLVDFAPIMGRVALPDALVDAVRCEDLAGRGDVLLPAELVFMPWTPADAPPLFGWTGNGLASGNSLDEATLHALLEVLERDATTVNRADDRSAWVDPEGLPPPFAELAGRWRRLGVELTVRHVPNDFGLPCFEAWLHEAASADVNLASGAGLHVDRDIALARAVCEAAQSRLSHIHGGRDDITRFYAKFRGADAPSKLQAEDRLIAALQDRGRRTDHGAVPDPGFGLGAPAAVLGELLARLRAFGFGTVLRRQFHVDGVDLQGLHVVRVVVARCESVHGDDIRMGPRLLQRVLGRG